MSRPFFSPAIIQVACFRARPSGLAKTGAAMKVLLFSAYSSANLREVVGETVEQLIWVMLPLASLNNAFATLVTATSFGNIEMTVLVDSIISAILFTARTPV